MVYINQADGDPLFVADSTGVDSRQIFVDQKGQHNHNPVWSPDGQWIYFVHGAGGSGEMDAWRIRSSGGTPERLTRNATVNFLAPLDSRTLLYVARAEDRSGPWLWALDVESKISRRVSSGLEQVHIRCSECRRSAPCRHRRQSQRKPLDAATARPRGRGQRHETVSAAHSACVVPTIRQERVPVLSVRARRNR